MATSVVTPEPKPLESGQPIPQQPPAAEPTPQQVDRNAVHDRYNQLYGQSPTEPPVATPQPAQTPPPTIPAAPANEVVEQLAQMQRTIDELRAQLPATVKVEPTPEQRADWIDLIRQGKFEEAQRAQEKQILDAIGPTIAEQAVVNATERFRAETMISQYLDKVHADNPDLLEMEPYIASVVEKRLAQVGNAGGIKNPMQFVEEYKKAVDAEISSARNLVQKLRAAGVTQAQTLRTEVLSQTPLPPNRVDQRSVEQRPQTQEPPSTSEYIKARQLATAKRMGLGG